MTQPSNPQQAQFHEVDIQHASDTKSPVADETLIHWATLTLSPHRETTELTIRLVNKDEIQALNARYRHQDKPTNVLAFPTELPVALREEIPLLGDIIICPDVLLMESETLSIPIEAHWAHIVIHGVLHLLGYDHMNEADEKVMQAFEVDLLKQLNYDNPYEGNLD